jgi:hypothetical protein
MPITTITTKTITKTMSRLLRVKSCAVLMTVLSMPTYATNFIDPNAQTSWLGRGVQSTSGLIKDACVTGDWVAVNNQTLSLAYQSSRSASRSLREMSGSMGASVNLGLFGGGVSVHMHTRLEENQNTASVVYRLSYKSKQYTLQNRSLTPLGAKCGWANPQPD